MPRPRAALLPLALLLTAPLLAQDKATPARPSDAVIAAWAKQGLTFGWYGTSREGAPEFQVGPGGLTAPLPAFRPTNRQIARLPKLTDPGVPFALDLRRSRITDRDLKGLAGLTSLTALNLGLTPVTGAGLKELKGLKNLTALDLWGAQVTDAGLHELPNFKGLTRLSLGLTRVTDAGLKDLKGLDQLTRLSLSHTEVTDKGLKELAGLKNLKSLALLYARVTDDGVEELKKALPGCKISK